MASIRKEFEVSAAPEFVWDAVREVGAVHCRLAIGFVADTALDGDVRTVTFANGYVVREQIIDVDDTHRRLAYTAIGGRASHHNASLQVFEGPEGRSRLVWITDLLPDSLRPAVAQMVELGAAAITQTLERPLTSRTDANTQ
jgi:hypothetical protein